jgi:type IV pilus assembly PilM-like protein
MRAIQPVVCLDLSLDRLAALQVRGKVIERWTVQAVDRGLLRHGEPQDPELLASAIRRTLDMADITARRARLTLPDEAAVVRVVSLPPMPARHLSRAVPYAAEQVLPFQPDQARLGWDVTARTDKQTTVLLVCAWKDVIERLHEAVSLAGLEPEVIEPRSLALGRALGGQDALVFEASDRAVQMTVLSVTQPIYSDQVACQPGEEARAIRLLLDRARKEREEEPVLVAGRLEDALASGRLDGMGVGPAGGALNGHGPVRPAEMPSNMLLASLGLATRSELKGYPEVNLLPAPCSLLALLRRMSGPGGARRSLRTKEDIRDMDRHEGAR